MIIIKKLLIKANKCDIVFYETFFRKFSLKIRVKCYGQIGRRTD